MDRNHTVQVIIVVVDTSLSARRAWIEIETCSSVPQTVKSLSARRAWIEIVLYGLQGLFVSVALRKESVDRNPVGVGCLTMIGGRSPQGERG